MSPAPATTLSATLMCSFGAAPATLSVLPIRRVMIEGRPVAVITDIAPMVNIPPFAMCSAPSNPAVAAATAAAFGVLTPMPCIPVVPVPWSPGAAKTLVGSLPVVDAMSQAHCAYGGVITVLMPGSTRTTVG